MPTLRTLIAIMLTLHMGANVLAQSQGKLLDDGIESQTPPVSASVSPGATGISPGSALGRPSETINSLHRELGKVGGDSQSSDDLSRSKTRPNRVEPPNQFQRFVQEATGRLLPIYGSQLFDGQQSYTPDNTLAVPANYVLGPGDEIRLQVWGAVDFSATLVLDRNGQVLVPKVGVVPLIGVTLRDLEPMLKTSLSKVFTNFSLSANLGRLRGIQIYVVGQAKQPGTCVISSLSTLVNALFVCGGPSANGSMRNIELQRASKTITSFDLYQFIARGDKAKDATLLPGDVIFIPPAGPRAAVTGAYDQAAIYELKAPLTSIADILALSGGTTATTSMRKALLERVEPTKSPARQVVDIPLDAKGLNQSLLDGDILTLLPISPAFSNAVTLQGVVAEPLRYPWFDGMKILDLIPEREALITPDYYKRKNNLAQGDAVASRDAGIKDSGARLSDRMRRMLDQINWDYAVIERLDRNKLTTNLVALNLGKAVLERDPAHNLRLYPGDVVTILSQTDLRLPQDRQTRFVRIEGEVAAPGIYQTSAGETLPQLIQRVGGLTSMAFVFGTELSRESIRARQQENLDTLIRRLEGQAQSQASVAASNLSSDRANQGQMQMQMQMQQNQIRAQIERLKSVKSNGRISMEIVHESPSLPPIPLEDGDRIHIPSVPAYVSAFGAVNNENVFLFRPNKTVGDIIKLAGLTEDAEPDQAFLLRADGSIVARQDQGGLFGNRFESMRVLPGDTLVIPTQLDRESRYNFVTRAVKDWTQIFANFGLGMAAIKTLRN